MAKPDVKVTIGGDNTLLKKSLDESKKLVSSATKNMADVVGTASVAMGASLAAVGAASVAMVASATAQAKEIGILAEVAGASVVELQNMAFATETVGIDMEKLADISKDVRDKLGDFIATGAGPFKDFFEQVAPKIGLTAKELQGLSGPDVLLAVQDAMDKANISIEEQIFYMEALGNDASRLIPLLTNEAEALNQLTASAESLNFALSETDIESLEKTAQGFKEIRVAVVGLANQFAAVLSPALNIVIGDVKAWYIENEKLLQSGIELLPGKIADGLLIVVETMRFVHDGFLGLKLVGVGAVQAIATGLDLFVKGITGPTGILNALSLVFDAAVKIGALDVNPIDMEAIRSGFATFKQSSSDVTISVLADIEKTNQKYDQAKTYISDMREELEKVAPVSTENANETAREMEKLANATGQTVEQTEKVTEKVEELVVEEVKLKEETIKTTTAFREQEAVMQGATAATDDLAESFYGLADAQVEAANPPGLSKGGSGTITGATYNTGDPTTDAALRIQNRQALQRSAIASNEAVFGRRSALVDYAPGSQSADTADLTSTGDIGAVLSTLVGLFSEAMATQTSGQSGGTNVYINQKMSRSDVSGLIAEQNRVEGRS